VIGWLSITQPIKRVKYVDKHNSERQTFLQKTTWRNTTITVPNQRSELAEVWQKKLIQTKENMRSAQVEQGYSMMQEKMVFNNMNCITNMSIPGKLKKLYTVKSISYHISPKHTAPERPKIPRAKAVSCFEHNWVNNKLA
jgi:hypothetical protein